MAVSIKGPGGGSTKMEITNGKLEEYVAYPEDIEKNTFIELNQEDIIMRRLIQYDYMSYSAHSKLVWEDNDACLVMFNETGNNIYLVYVNSDKNTEPAILTSYGFSVDQCHFIGRFNDDTQDKFAFYLYDYNLGARLVVARYNKSVNEMGVGTALSTYNNDSCKYSVIGNNNIITIRPLEYSYSSGARVEVTLYTVDVLTITERNTITAILDDKYNSSRPGLNDPYITGDNSAIIFAKKDLHNEYTITPIFISENEVSNGTSVADPDGWNAFTNDLHLPVDDTSLIWYENNNANYCILKGNELYVGEIETSIYSNFEAGVMRNVSSGKVIYHSSNVDPNLLMYLERTDTTLTKRFYDSTTDIKGIVYDIFIPSYDSTIVHFVGAANNRAYLWRAEFKNNTIVYKDVITTNGYFDGSSNYVGRAGDIAIVSDYYDKAVNNDTFQIVFLNYDSIKDSNEIFDYKPPYKDSSNSIKILNDGKRVWVIYYDNENTIFVISHVIDLTVDDVYAEKSDKDGIVFHISGILKLFPLSNGVKFVSFIRETREGDSSTKDTFAEFSSITNSNNDVIIPGVVASKAKNKIDGLTAEKIKKLQFGNVTVLNTKS